jgi:DNA-binding transcriptional LysR family regulator
MDIQDIQIFARVAAVQNLSAVGTELGLTPGTISKRLQALEDDLSVRLFERTTRSIRITDEGVRFLKHVETILAELDKARASVAEAAGHPKGRLKIIASQALSQAFVLPAVIAFMGQYRDIDVHVDLSDMPINLREAGYDVAIFAGALSDSSMIAKRLAPDRQVLVAAPAYLSSHGTPDGVDALAQHACLALGDAWSWQLVGTGLDKSVRIEPRLRSDSADFLRRAAIEGMGIAALSHMHVQDDLREGRLVRLFDDVECGRDAAIWAVYSSAKHVLPRLRVFLDFLGDWFRNQPQKGTSG